MALRSGQTPLGASRSSTMRIFAYVCLAAAAAFGCGESVPPAGSGDAGRDAAVDLDSSVDEDASVDGGLDAGTPDGGPDGGGPYCNTSALCPSCPNPALLCDAENPCPIGQVCISTGCDDFARCFVAGGGACVLDEDCGDSAYRCEPELGRCLRIDPGCEDSNDCIAGFACENGACVDRRVPCVVGADCPHGFTCFFASPDQRFCRRIGRPCVDDVDCLTLGVPCGDVDGDLTRECMPSLTPNTPDAVSCANAQCTDPIAPVCESTVQGTAAICGTFGPCTTVADCADGFECRDLWGDGRPECVLPAGSCQEDPTLCPERTVCASARPSEPPSCVSGAAQ